MRKFFWLKLIAMSSLLFSATMASHFLIYKALIVPQLPNLKAVPLVWWLGVFAPELVVFIAFGSVLKSWRELVSFAIVAGIVQQFSGYLLARWNEPGHLKAAEPAIFYWIVGLAVLSFVSAILFLMGMLMAKAVRKTKYA